jgi:hypothetical protein
MVNSWKGDLFGGKILRTAAVTAGLLFGAGAATAQKAPAWRDPVEPAQGAPKVKMVARPEVDADVDRSAGGLRDAVVDRRLGRSEARAGVRAGSDRGAIE